MAFMCFLAPKSVKLLLLCITQFLNIKIHLQLHSCLHCLDIDGEAFSLLFSIAQSMRPFLKLCAVPGRLGMEECSLDFIFLLGQLDHLVFWWERGCFFPINETRFSKIK